MIAWEPPVRLYHAGRETQGARYRVDAAGHRGPPRLLLQYTCSGCGLVAGEGRSLPVPVGSCLLLAVPGPGVYACAAGGVPWGFAFASLTCPQLPTLPTPVLDLTPVPELRDALLALIDRRLAGDEGPQALPAYHLLLGLLAALEAGDHGPEARLAERLAQGDDRRIAALARELGFTHAALTRRFTRRYGEPPRAWAERLRLRTACRALAAGHPPGTAGRAAGFADPAHFGRTFRRRLGLTPGAWQELPDALRDWP